MIFKENSLTVQDYQCLRESVGWLRMQQEQAAAALGRGLCTLAVLEGDTPVGMGRLIGDGLYDTIVDVVVRPEYQGQGIGRAIIGRLLACAAQEMPPGGRVSVSLIAEKGKDPFYALLSPNAESIQLLPITFYKLFYLVLLFLC